MTLPWAMIDDTTDDSAPNEIGTYYPAFYNTYIFSSPSGNFIAGQGTSGSGVNNVWLVDSSANPPVLLWNINSSIAEMLGDNPYTEPFEFQLLAVDDDGDVWGKTGFNDGLVVKLSQVDGAASLEFSFADDGGLSSGLTPRTIFAFAVTGGTKILVYPEGDVLNNNVRGLLGTKGTPGLTQHETGGFYTWDAFLDDNEDVWMAGASVAPSSSMSVKRITSNSTTYPAEQSFVMPANGRATNGAFRGGSYVGGWEAADSGHVENLFAAVLDGSGDVTTRDISADPFIPNGGSGPIYSESRPLTDPTRQFWVPVSDTRQVVDIHADLTEGESFHLDDWLAGDNEVPADAPSIPADYWNTPQWPIYLPGPNALASTRQYTADAPSPANINVGDLYLYYFGDVPGGGDVEDPTLKVWGFSLDGHDFYCLRLGDSETLVYDLTTGQWSSWKSPERDNWRAVVGQNWVGTSSTTVAHGFGTDVIAGDDSAGILWILDPSTGQDDAIDGTPTPFTRIVTGGVTLAGRQTAPCGAVTLNLNLGDPALTGAAITLRTSDDQGRNWTDHGAVTVAAGEYDAVCEWRALGMIRAPGRVFEFSDHGATVRINLADMR